MIKRQRDLEFIDEVFQLPDIDIDNIFVPLIQNFKLSESYVCIHDNGQCCKIESIIDCNQAPDIKLDPGFCYQSKRYWTNLRQWDLV